MRRWYEQQWFLTSLNEDEWTQPLLIGIRNKNVNAIYAYCWFLIQCWLECFWVFLALFHFFVVKSHTNTIVRSNFVSNSVGCLLFAFYFGLVWFGSFYNFSLLLFCLNTHPLPSGLCVSLCVQRSTQRTTTNQIDTSKWTVYWRCWFCVDTVCDVCMCGLLLNLNHDWFALQRKSVFSPSLTIYFDLFALSWFQGLCEQQIQLMNCYTLKKYSNWYVDHWT